MKADHLSSPNQPIITEWSLHPEITTLIFELYCLPAVDMVATVHHTELPVHVSDSGATSTGSGCTITTLAGTVDVHVSSISLAEQDHLETLSHPDQREHTDHPLVAISAVVSTCSTVVCGSVSVSLKPSRSVVSSRLHLGWEVEPSASMVVLMQHLQAAGFSDEVFGLAAAG